MESLGRAENWSLARLFDELVVVEYVEKLGVFLLDGAVGVAVFVAEAVE